MAEQDHGVDADAETAAIDGIEAGSVDGLMKQLTDMLGGEGWEGINTDAQALQKQRAEQMRAMRAEANLFAECFETPAGRKVLQIMIDRTKNARPYPAEAQLSTDQITPLIIAHDAQCNFVDAILSAIALSNQN